MTTLTKHSLAFLSKLADDNLVIGIVGMGYVGLPLGIAFAEAGVKVIGFDIDKSKTLAITAGKSYIKHVKSEDVMRLVKTAHLAATSDFEHLNLVDAVLICVPTPLREHEGEYTPDLSFVESTAEQIVLHLREGMLIVLESTTYPGTTEEVLRPILEKSGLSANKDFLLAYSPEREDPGNKEHSVTNTPKVVGGHNDQASWAAGALYERIAPEVVHTETPAVAEACKILENTYRCVNIALINELKQVFEAMGVDVWEVIEAAKTKPFGFQAFYPGPGLGGHCIPIDPFYLSWKAKQCGIDSAFIELAGKVNRAMPGQVVARLGEALLDRYEMALIDEPKIMILGVAYKPNVDDDRESPAYEIMSELVELGAIVCYNDPHVPVLKKSRQHNLEMTSTELSPEVLGEMDAVVIITDHSEYDPDFIVEHSKLVIDTRNLTKSVKEKGDKIVKA